MEQAKQILVVDILFAVGEFGEAVIDLVELGAGEFVAEFGETLFKHAAAAVFAEHHIVRWHPRQTRVS